MPCCLAFGLLCLFSSRTTHAATLPCKIESTEKHRSAYPLSAADAFFTIKTGKWAPASTADGLLADGSMKKIRIKPKMLSMDEDTGESCRLLIPHALNTDGDLWCFPKEKAALLSHAAAKGDIRAMAVSGAEKSETLWGAAVRNDFVVGTLEDNFYMCVLDAGTTVTEVENTLATAGGASGSERIAKAAGESGFAREHTADAGAGKVAAVERKGRQPWDKHDCA